MKKSCLLLLVAATLCISTAKAQQVPDLRTQATENTRKLAQQISLDDARTPQVKRLTYERLVQENDLKQMYSIDPAMLQSKMAVVEKEYAEKLKEVLSTTQYQRYLAATAPTPVTLAAAPTTPVAPSTVVAPVTKATTIPKHKATFIAPAKKAGAGTHASTKLANHH